jgi:hypothetical protein
MHTFMNAQAYYMYYMQECHKLNAHTTYAHMMYAWSTQETLKLHTCTLTCITYATYITYTSMLQACQRHTVCILHANRMPHMHACMPHSYYCMHAIVIHTAHTYSACMHTIPTCAGYLLLHVNFMQNT